MTGLPKERPDVWTKDPFSSVVLQARAGPRANEIQKNPEILKTLEP